MTVGSLALLAAVTIAFPQEGARFGFTEKCYVIGASDGGETNILVSGVSVPVYRTGAWGVLLDVKPGLNVITAGDLKRTFYIKAKPKPSGKQNLTPSSPRKYKKLAYAADTPKERPLGRSPSQITIVLDPGHGGEDSGAVSPHGRFEKDANLAISKLVQSELIKMGYRAFLTREEDVAIALYERPKLAHSLNADCFVSIHYNAPPYDRDPTKIRYHAVYAWNDIGKALASAINLRMDAVFSGVMSNNGVMSANFAVTRNPEIPSCLVETDFITSPQGEESTWDEATRKRVAKAIAEGISDWCLH
ncbi:MAG: N-acetylmuramoyl-L-alanine amidase [Kiritimatiellae bacterium]|nr:N-acetylmuramoyl-L-alanine amidase [Kiritimatiellia bacterium]